jgi:hypothetical protein
MALNSSSNQKESKALKGGKRAGAGRKPSTLKGIARKLPKETAEILLAEIKAESKWKKLAASDDERIVLDTLKYLTDRAHGKATQAMEVTGKDGEPIQTAIEVTFVRTHGSDSGNG